MKTLSLLITLCCVGSLGAADKPIKILFLGDNGHHKPAERFRQLQPVFDKRGIELVYTDKVDALEPKTLAAYDGLMVYANTTKITPEQEKALLDYVESGKGFIPLHCASYCFLNSPKYIDLVGAQFQKHGTGVFRTTIADAEHPIMKGFKGFESWDETYQHTKHNEKDRTVLELRDKEPWTWVRTQGKGRVFYTAWGHDDRTWSNPGFHALVERGVRWAIGGDPSIVPAPAVSFTKPEMTPKRTDAKPFEYVDASIPFYAPKDGKTERPKQMQKPLPVEESIKHFVTPVDFEPRVFVTEDKLGGKPIAMTWDEQGRLWVSVTIDYPNELQPEGEGRDRILVCEDTDGDGVCDKVTTFADKLSIPTSLLNVYGGIVVYQAPHTLFLKDTDGDGKADLRQVLFTGWGTGDTHAGPSNLRYGLDNWVYGMVGYSGFNGEIAGEKFSFRQGLHRFKLEREPNDPHKLKVAKFEFLRSTSNNSWGVGFTEEGHLFGSTANGCASVFMPIPNRYYEKVRGLSPGVLPNIAVDNHIEPITDKVRQVDWHHGFTAAAGHEIYTARTYPKEYWNKVAFICEPTGHLCAAMQITPNGSSFTTKYGWNLLASDDEWSSPIDAQVGPDGNVWVIDWYSFIVQHNPTPPGFKNGKGNAYETPLRDKKHGRIYRVVYKPAAVSDQLSAKKFTLKDAKPEQLVDALKNDNMKWRLHAQRLLVERGKSDVLNSLEKLAADTNTDAVGLNGGAVHAIWTMAGLERLDTAEMPPKKEIERFRERIQRLDKLKHPSAPVRLNLARVGYKLLWDFAIIEMARQDRDPHVRVAALLQIAEHGAAFGSKELICGSIAELLLISDLFKDKNWLEAFTIAAASHPDFLGPLLSEEHLFLRAVLEPVVLQCIETAVATAAAQKRLDSHVGSSDFYRGLMQANSRTTAALLNGLARGWPKNHVPEITPEASDALLQAFDKIPPSSRNALAKLGEAWKVKGIAERLVPAVTASLAAIADEKTEDKRRIEAAKQVVELRTDSDEVVGKLLAILSARSTPELAAGIFEALSISEAPQLGAAVLSKFAALSPAGRRDALRLLLSRAATTRHLVEAFEKGHISINELTLEQRQALSSHTDKDIAKRAKALLAKGGGLPDADREKVIKELFDVRTKKGDADLGLLVFKAQCAKCHVHGSEGTRIGPDLTGVAVHSKEHLLIDILDPSRSVEGNFRVWKVVTADGKTLNGLLTAETKTSIEIVDAEAKKQTIQREDIETLTVSNKSLMPEGFEKQFKGDDLVNLLEFLTKKGKYLPIPLDKAATIVTTKGMFFSEASTIERMIFPDWKPKLFEGIPFQLVDPQGDKVRNAILLHGPNGTIAPTMPKTVTVPCNSAARAVHLLSGVSGWGSTGGNRNTISMIVRLHYADGKTEDHPLKDGVHFADYIRRIDVPGSKFAFALRGQQIRYLAVTPSREEVIKEIEFVKGPDATAPIVMAVTVETK